ncbi:MAG TPA: type II secretion system protein [Pyrinomonadaceae bacterium]|jgi:prepilin-type N-terminal cleavage/methylation domain-containing protein
MKNNQAGFSLIELLLVITILGIISTISIPLLIKAKESAENQSAYSAMRALSTMQISYFSQNNRFARLDELVTNQSGFGNLAGDTLTRGRYKFVMEPLRPDDEALKKQYKIVVTSPVAGSEVPYMLSVDERGQITEPLAP